MCLSIPALRIQHFDRVSIRNQHTAIILPSQVLGHESISLTKDGYGEYGDAIEIRAFITIPPEIRIRVGATDKVGTQGAVLTLFGQEPFLDEGHHPPYNSSITNTRKDTQMESTQTSKPGMVYSTYGIHDWMVNQFHTSVISACQSLAIKQETWIAGARFDMSVLPSVLQLNRYHYTSKTSMILQSDAADVLVECVLDGMKLVVQAHASLDTIDRVFATLDAKFDRIGISVHWVYGQHGQSSTVPLNFKTAYDEFYPFLSSPLDKFYSEYIERDESVLILIGPPGTGKTTFIKNLLNFSGSDAMVTFDPAIMSSDSLFARFIDDEGIDFLVMEDADTFLQSRSDGNQMMHKFLNVSDGLISTRGKKLVFSTNLPSISDIDTALLRPGRCFRVVEFRTLTNEEADAVGNVVNIYKIDGKTEYSLAELLSPNTAEQREAVRANTRKMGFV